jgi:hypothetical protein
MSQTFAIILQPKSKQVVFAALGPNEDNVSVYNQFGEFIGRGWYGDDHALDGEYLSRVHVGRNNFQKGTGWGSALYTALCTGARMRENFRDVDLPEMPSPASAVYSRPDDRSGDARNWWAAAVERGQAKKVRSGEYEEEEGEEREEEISFKSRRSEYSDIVDEINNYLEWNHDIYSGQYEIPDIRVSWTTTEEIEIMFDVLAYDDASDLVLCNFRPREITPDSGWPTREEIEDFNPDVLRLFDLSEAPEETIQLIRHIAKVMGAEDDLKDNPTLTRSNRRYNGLTPAQQAAARRVRLADWADLDD